MLFLPSLMLEYMTSTFCLQNQFFPNLFVAKREETTQKAELCPAKTTLSRAELFSLLRIPGKSWFYVCFLFVFNKPLPLWDMHRAPPHSERFQHHKALENCCCSFCSAAVTESCRSPAVLAQEHLVSLFRVPRTQKCPEHIGRHWKVNPTGTAEQQGALYFEFKAQQEEFLSVHSTRCCSLLHTK